MPAQPDCQLKTVRRHLFDVATAVQPDELSIDRLARQAGEPRYLTDISRRSEIAKHQAANAVQTTEDAQTGDHTGGASGGVGVELNVAVLHVGDGCSARPGGKEALPLLEDRLPENRVVGPLRLAV